MDIKQIEIFSMLAREKIIGKAASHLHLTVAAVSKRLKKLVLPIFAPGEQMQNSKKFSDFITWLEIVDWELMESNIK